MTNSQIAKALGVSERHARRLRARRDPRVERILRGDPQPGPNATPVEVTIPTKGAELDAVLGNIEVAELLSHARELDRRFGKFKQRRKPK